MFVCVCAALIRLVSLMKYQHGIQREGGAGLSMCVRVPQSTVYEALRISDHYVVLTGTNNN